MLKTKTFFTHLFTKPPAKHPRIRGFWLYFAKKLLRPQTKMEKAPTLSWLLLQDFFAHPITKPPASTLLEFKNVDYFRKKFCDFRKKREKRLHPAGSCWWPAVTRTLSILQSFQTFLKHNVGNPETSLDFCLSRSSSWQGNRGLPQRALNYSSRKVAQA